MLLQRFSPRAEASSTGPSRSHVVAGVRAMLPFLAGVSPFGVAIGASVAASGFDPLAGWSTSWAIYSGTPQMMTLQMVDSGASSVAIFAAVMAVNLRLAVYAAALVPDWRGASRRWQIFAAYLITDPTYVVARRHATIVAEPAARRAHYVGSALALWCGWLLACAGGLLVGGRLTDLVPPGLFLDLVLVGMVVPMVRRPPVRRAGAIAAALVLPGLVLPAGVGVVVAAVCGAVAALHRSGRASSVGCREERT
jgi:predicted branched-subunit amino acid permease